MDVDQYVAARYGRLVEHAVRLGCPDVEAAGYVDQVLRDQRKRIRRAEDPDPLVHEALERAILGEPEPSRLPRIALLLFTALVVAAVGIGVALDHHAKRDQVPSLFALDSHQAEQLLEQRGFDVRVRPEGSCDPIGLVVGSEPPSNGHVDEDGTVTVRTSVISGSYCEATFPWRVLAWQFLRYVLDLGEAPAFTSNLQVYVDGRVSHDRWDDLASAVENAASKALGTQSGLPVVLVQRLMPPRRWCGTRRPPHERNHSAVRMQLTDSDEDLGGCPLTIDLYRDEKGRISTIAAYRAAR